MRLGMMLADSDERGNGGDNLSKKEVVTMILCSNCGGETRVKSTIKAYDVAIRYRKCIDCGTNVKHVMRLSPACE